MRVLKDAICKFCKNIFCCAECRHKHEVKNHAIAVRETKKITEHKDDIKSTFSKSSECNQIYLFCSICENRPLALEPELQKEMLLHIKIYHLPLRCQKCLKIYNNVNDLKDFTRCLSHNQELLSFNQSCYTDEASKVTVTKAALPQCVITQCSPTGQDNTANHKTPISIINMRWKAKSKQQQEDFISDSVSSIKNISSISNSSNSRSTEMASAVKGKVVRCSSTPVQLEVVFAKPKEQTFNASGGGHMSSIQYSSGCESDASPAFSQPNSQSLEPVNRYIKVTGSRPRMTAVTPLRQVMSRSIQKAFAEHGLPPSNIGRISYTFQRKNIFDSNSPPETDALKSPLCRALDLRLSPAVRRSQSESSKLETIQTYNNKKEYNEQPYLRREILLSAKKLTTESIVITRTEHLSTVSSSSSAVSSNFSMNTVKPTNSTYQSAACNSVGSSIFKSCRSVEIITETREEIQNMHSFDKENLKNTTMRTPITRIPGLAAMHKKNIKFETPKIEEFDSGQSPNSPNEEFFTPNATSIDYFNEIESNGTNQRKLLVKHNLNEEFKTLQAPSTKEYAHSTAIGRIGSVTNSFGVLHISDDEDEVYLPMELESMSKEEKCDKNQNPSQKPACSLWSSIMTSVMRLPSIKGKTQEEPLKNETYSRVDSSSKSIIKRCASIAGSLVRSNSLLDENDVGSLKRKRTHTADNQLISSYWADSNSVEATSPISNSNTSSKRFRIQGRRPIARMRLNS